MKKILISHSNNIEYDEDTVRFNGKEVADYEDMSPKEYAYDKGSTSKLVLDFMYQIVHGYIRPEVLVRNVPGSG